MNLVNRPNSLEAALEEALDAMHIVATAENWETSKWTNEIKLRVGNVGEARSLGVYSSAHRGQPQKRPGWLFDLTFLQQKDGYLERCVLALESEWGGYRAISDDFQKLMVARSDHRLLVFDAGSKEHAEQLIHDLIEEISQYQAAQFGDRYLFAAWVRDHGFVFRTHVAGSAA